MNWKVVLNEFWNIQVGSSEDNLSNCCVVQYVLFPPHRQLITKTMISDESAESDVNEIEGDYQLVMEVWVEPQLGTMEVSNTPLSYLHGTEYFDIPGKVIDQNMYYTIICFWNWLRYILRKRRLYCVDNPIMGNVPHGNQSLIRKPDTDTETSQCKLIDLSLYNEIINLGWSGKHLPVQI